MDAGAARQTEAGARPMHEAVRAHQSEAMETPRVVVLRGRGARVVVLKALRAARAVVVVVLRVARVVVLKALQAVLRVARAVVVVLRVSLVALAAAWFDARAKRVLAGLVAALHEAVWRAAPARGVQGRHC